MTATGHVPFRTKIAYGIGAMAYGIKDNGFSVFLLLFYNQVIGLDAAIVGSVIALALVFDALIDPLIGVLSDRTHTRWGRRHPWLYASAVPIGLSWLLLWHPPQGSQSMILGWLLVTAIFTRAAIATNEVPSSGSLRSTGKPGCPAKEYPADTETGPSAGSKAIATPSSGKR